LISLAICIYEKWLEIVFNWVYCWHRIWLLLGNYTKIMDIGKLQLFHVTLGNWHLYLGSSLISVVGEKKGNGNPRHRNWTEFMFANYINIWDKLIIINENHITH
jgi:hypothetical protein